MTIADLTPEEVKEALQRTMLCMVFSQFPVKGGALIQAAHSNMESFIILRTEDGEFSGWRVTEATKQERKDHYQAMIKKWQDSGEGAVFRPDGREIKL